MLAASLALARAHSMRRAVQLLLNTPNSANGDIWPSCVVMDNAEEEDEAEEDDKEAAAEAGREGEADTGIGFCSSPEEEAWVERARVWSASAQKRSSVECRGKSGQQRARGVSSGRQRTVFIAKELSHAQTALDDG